MSDFNLLSVEKLKREVSMKKVILIITVLFLVSNLVAQTKTIIKLNTGLNVPSSTKYFSDYWGASYNFGGGIDVFLDSQLSLQGYIDYNHFSLDGQKVLEDLKQSNKGNSISGSALNILHLSANVKYHLINVRQKVSPYIIGGLGYVILSLTDFVGTNTNGDTGTLVVDESIGAFSISFGLGTEFLISSGISIFVDVRYVIGFTEDKVARYNSDGISGVKKTGTYSLTQNTQFIPIRAGISFGL